MAPPRPVRARIATSIVFAANGAMFATWSARVPAVQQQLGLSPGALSTSLLGLAFGAVGALLLTGWLVARFGSTTVVRFGFVVFGVGLALPGYAPNLTTLTIVLACVGAGNSIVDVAMNTHAVRVEHAYRRPIFSGFHATWSVGGLVGAGFGALAASADITTRLHFPVAAAGLAAAGLAAAAVGFLPREPVTTAPAVLSLPGRRLLILGVALFCAFVAEGTANDWAAVYLTSSTGASPALAASAYLAFSAGMVLGRVVTDRLVMKIGRRAFLSAACVVSIAGLALAITVPTPAAATAGFVAFGLGLAGLAPVLFSAAGELAPASPGPAIAAVATLGYLGFLTGPVLIGGLAEASTLRLAMTSVLALLALAAILTVSSRNLNGAASATATVPRTHRANDAA